MQEHITGIIHSIETMGLMDGPGVRTVFFLQGCPLRCAYCHNPDSQPPASPGQRVMTPKEVLEVALRQRSYFGAEGGVTFSGGEPLRQGAFLLACLKLLKQHGINTAVDTSGFGGAGLYDQLFPLIDLMLLDVKAFDAQAFHALTGGDFGVYTAFLAALEKHRFQGQVWVRHVMVPGLTDTEEAMDQLVDIILPLAYLVDRIEILPYHVMGVDKYRQMGLAYRLEGVPPMDKARARALEQYALRRFVQRRPVTAVTRIKEEQYKMSDTGRQSFAAAPYDSSPYIHEGIDLRKLPLLRHLSVAEFEELAQDIRVRRVKKGETIFKSGDNADNLYIVCEGQFKIFTYTPDGREQIMYMYNPGDFVGGLNLLKSHSYLYTGQALEDGVICTMSKPFFDRVCLHNPRILRQILEKSYDRIRWAEELISRLSSTNAGIKVAELLLRFSDRYGVDTPEGRRIDFNLNREELGSYAGLTRETFTRKLGEFKDLGYLDFTGSRVILIKNEEALREYFSAL